MQVALFKESHNTKVDGEIDQKAKADKPPKFHHQRQKAALEQIFDNETVHDNLQLHQERLPGLTQIPEHSI